MKRYLLLKLLVLLSSLLQLVNELFMGFYFTLSVCFIDFLNLDLLLEIFEVLAGFDHGAEHSETSG